MLSNAIHRPALPYIDSEWSFDRFKTTDDAIEDIARRPEQIPAIEAAKLRKAP